MKKFSQRFLVCVENADCDDLPRGKIYAAVPDKSAARSDLIRVVDESGEDHLYPPRYFIAISLPLEVRRALAKTKKKFVA